MSQPHRPANPDPHGKEAGVALLLVLWVLILLMVIVMSFSYMTRTETEAGLYFRERVRDDLIAEAGIQRAILEIILARRAPGADDEWDRYGGLNTGGTGGHGYEVRIVPETSKVDLNQAPEVILKGLLAALGIEAERQDVIVDSLQDWKDGDDLHRLNGAEDDYYASLERPYRCRNGKLESIDELLLVRGVTEEIFYGTRERRGLREFVTVFSGTPVIEINSAEREVLLAIPGMTPEIADAIIEYREASPFKTTTELQGVVGGAYSTMARYITVAEGNTYRITANSRGSGYGVMAVVRLNGSDYSVLDWKKPVALRVKGRDEEAH